MAQPHDLAVIGAGAGGLIAARFAAKVGARVLLIEKERVGGDCTWTGCVPSKSLIRAAKAAHEIRTASRFGIGAPSCVVNMREVRDYVQRRVQEIYEPTSPEALSREGIDVALGPASFDDVRTIRVGDRLVTASRYLICTGARPSIPNVPGLSSVTYRTYHNIFDIDQLPASLAVIGGGPLGVELAQAFQRLGAAVTIVAARLLPHDDRDAARVIARVFAREGIRIVEGRAISVQSEGGAAVVSTDVGIDVEADMLLVAAGRRPNVEELGLDRAGIVHSPRGIVVDDRLRTNVPHIYAAGDVLGREQFSHVAGWQAFEATRNALLPGSASGRPNPMAWVTLTDPEVAQIGLSEAAARERHGDRVVVEQWDLPRIDRAKCDGDEDGFVKMVCDSDGTILGATIVAARAGELSGEISLAVAHGLTVGDMSTAVHAYPTYATALQQMASDMALARWTSSATGRLVHGLLGYDLR